jgi:hypothetical protein
MRKLFNEVKMNYVHTLCWNLPSIVDKAIKSLYDLNNKKDFKHIIVDLGFPLIEDKIPEDIEKNKAEGSEILKEMANRYGSKYLKIKNVGVSQNWDAVRKYLKVKDGDILCCQDPDEIAQTPNWIKAVGDVMRTSGKYGWISLTMPEHLPILNPINTREYIINRIRVWEVIGSLNWAQGGFYGKFLNDYGKVEYMNEMPIYGGIEQASLYAMKQTGYTWAMLPDYIVNHEDYEKGSPGHSKLLRQWKNHIIFETKTQITFEQWLKEYL